MVDFERALADPADPGRLRGLRRRRRPAPNDAGMHAMAAAIDLSTLWP